MSPLSSKTKALLILSRGYCDVLLQGANAPYRLPFPPEIVKDMDVLNQEALTKLLDDFIKANAIPAVQAQMIFMPDITFEKLVPLMPAEELQKLIQEFTDYVPFDDVGYKVVQITNGYLIVAANKQLYETIQKAFEKNNSIVHMAIPASALGQNAVVNGALSPDALQLVLSKPDEFKNYNFISSNIPQTASDVTNKPASKVPTLYILLGVFGLLLLVLFILLFLQMNTPAPKPKLPIVIPTAVPTQGVSNEIASPSARVVTNVKIQILAASETSSTAATLKNELTAQQFTDVSVEKATITVNRPQITFPSALATNVKEKLFAITQKIFPEVVANESTQSTTVQVIVVSQ